MADFSVASASYTSRRTITPTISFIQGMSIANDYISNNPPSAQALSIDPLNMQVTYRIIVQDPMGRSAGHISLRLRNQSEADTMINAVYNCAAVSSALPSGYNMQAPVQTSFSIRIVQDIMGDRSHVNITPTLISIVGYSDPAIMVPIEAWADSNTYLQGSPITSRFIPQQSTV